MSDAKERVSRNMKSNKSKDTKPELVLRKELWSRGIRYRKNCKKVKGKPDMAFPTLRIAVFVDGRMWHGYDWDNQKNDFKSNRDFWIPKIEKNIERDKIVTKELTKQGWLVMRFWDFEINRDVKACADKIEMVYINKKNEVLSCKR
ncbi:MAG: very short patch repair endonuclease [Clostridia bacterium]|nr:very short patch repair endonuclease [Clostridia bacterium]